MLPTAGAEKASFMERGTFRSKKGVHENFLCYSKGKMNMSFCKCVVNIFGKLRGD